MKCLVVGGGFGGLSAITGLRKKDKNVEIILVEPKSFFEVLWASYRTGFDEKTRNGALFDLEEFCKSKNVTQIKSTVTALNSTEATLDNGETVSFDVALVAVGAGYPWKGVGRTSDVKVTPADRKEEMVQEADKLMNAAKVVVVGGGLIGTELASDVAFFKAQAKKPVDVTIVHSKDRLCEGMSEKASAMVTKKVEALGVKIVYKEKAVQGEDGKWTLESSGDALEVDEIAVTTGFTSTAAKFMEASALNDKGWIVADEYFRVKDAGGKIFTVGDCCTQMGNAGAAVLNNIAVLGNNLSATLKAVEAEEPNLEGIKLQKLKDPGPGYCVTVGKKAGVFYMPAFYTQYMLPGLKNSTQFFMKPKGDLGLKPFKA